MARIHYKKAYLQINKYHQKEKVSYSVDQVATSIYRRNGKIKKTFFKNVNHHGCPVDEISMGTRLNRP